MSSLTSITAPARSAAVAPAAKAAPDLSDIGDPTKMPDHDVTFSEVLSTLNPLQYIPVIGSIYRAVTGDTISPAAQVVGGTLLGGPMGLIASAANAILAQSTGKDVGDRLVAWLTPGTGNDRPAPQTQYAANGAATPAPAAAASEATPPQAQAATKADAAAAAAPASQPAAATSESASAQPTAMPAPIAQGTTAPPQSGALAGTGAPASPGAAIAMGSTAAGSKGWTLADYRTFAGHGLPPSAGANGAQLRNTPVPLQTTMPLPNDTGHSPVIPAVVQTPANVAPAAAAAPATSQPQDTWVSEAMMRGLDRYREMMRQQQSPQQQQMQPAPASN